MATSSLKKIAASTAISIFFLFVFAPLATGQNAPAPQIMMITNSASYAPGMVAGSLASAFVTGIVPQGTNGCVTAATPYPTTLGGVGILVSAPDIATPYAAPLLAVCNIYGREQINFQVPWEIARSTNSTAMVAITGAGGRKASASVPLYETQPGIFSAGDKNIASAFWPAITSTLENPAHPGDMVAACATGLGPVVYQQTDGVPAGYYFFPGNIVTAGPASVTIGDGTIPVWMIPYTGTLFGQVGIMRLSSGFPTVFKTFRRVSTLSRSSWVAWQVMLSCCPSPRSSTFTGRLGTVRRPTSVQTTMPRLFCRGILFSLSDK
jgi:uncharacterized protein (TIGR03437 family)